jgi:hypothetical protein
MNKEELTKIVDSYGLYLGEDSSRVELIDEIMEKFSISNKQILENAINCLENAIFENTTIIWETGYAYINGDAFEKIFKDFKRSFSEYLGVK